MRVALHTRVGEFITIVEVPERLCSADCEWCARGNDPIRSSVSDAFVHTNTPVGRVLCKGQHLPEVIIWGVRVFVLDQEAGKYREAFAYVVPLQEF